MEIRILFAFGEALVQIMYFAQYSLNTLWGGGGRYGFGVRKQRHS